MQPNELDTFRSVLAETLVTESASPESPVAARLAGAAHKARSAGYRVEVADDLDRAQDALDADESDRGVDLWMLMSDIRKRKMDDPFLSHRVEGLRMARASVASQRFVSLETGVAGDPIKTGALLPVSTQEGEQVQLVVAGIITLMCNRDLADFDSVLADLPEDRRHERDSRFLEGGMQVSYEIGVRERLLWGAGLVAFAQDRVFGFLLTDVIEALDDSPARFVLPRASVESDGSGSVVAFSLDKTVIASSTAETGWAARKTPMATLEGAEFAFSIMSSLVLSPAKVLAKPGKGEIASFVNSYLHR